MGVGVGVRGRACMYVDGGACRNGLRADGARYHRTDNWRWWVGRSLLSLAAVGGGRVVAVVDVGDGVIVHRHRCRRRRGGGVDIIHGTEGEGVSSVCTTGGGAHLSFMAIDDDDGAGRCRKRKEEQDVVLLPFVASRRRHYVPLPPSYYQLTNDHNIPQR